MGADADKSVGSAELSWCRREWSITSTVLLPAGDVAVIAVAPTTTNAVAAAPPKFTAVAPVKLVPVMVTAVPPAAAPLFGATEVTAGAAP